MGNGAAHPKARDVLVAGAFRLRMAVTFMGARTRGTRILVHVLCRMALRLVRAIALVSVRALSTRVVDHPRVARACRVGVAIALVSLGASRALFVVIDVLNVGTRRLDVPVAFMANGAFRADVIADVLDVGTCRLLRPIACETRRARSA
jgi:hypothetical protein